MLLHKVTTDGRAHHVLSGSQAEDTRTRVAGAVYPSAELLDRALAGWDRFLATFEGAPDE
ncbi:hypothetical protein [Streptomyces sp. NPDC048606]|uniref:hypothetical protein n=1 Tax=Streptomyces sp. NPDC048606 TaxID=3154726 RepID=UPI003435D48C